MKLQSQKASEYKGKTYHKHWIVIPNKVIKEVGWKTGDTIIAEIKEKKVILEKT